MKNAILMMGLLLSTSAFAADDAQVGRGIGQVQRARHQLAEFVRSLPPALRGFAGKINEAEATLALAEGTLQASFQGGRASSYVCSVQEKAFKKVYVGRGRTQTEAFANAMNECSSSCNTFGYENLGCEAVQ